MSKFIDYFFGISFLSFVVSAIVFVIGYPIYFSITLSNYWYLFLYLISLPVTSFLLLWGLDIVEYLRNIE